MNILSESAVKLITGIIENTISVAAIKKFIDENQNDFIFADYMNRFKYIYSLSYFFLEQRDFEEISDYVKSKGLNADFFNCGRNFYWIWAYYKGDEKLKQIAIDKMNMFEIFFGDIRLKLITLMLTGDKRIYEKIFDYYFSRDDFLGCYTGGLFLDNFFDDFFLYAAVNKRSDILENLICYRKSVCTEYLAALAISHTDLFYDFLAKYHKELIPCELFNEDGKLKPLNEYITALFTDVMLWKTTNLNNLTTIGIIRQICRITGMEGLDKIKKYIPQIQYVESSDFGDIQSLEGLKKIVSDKAGEDVFLNCSFSYDMVYYNEISPLFSLFEKSRLYMEVDKLLMSRKEREAYKLLRSISNNKIHGVFKEKKSLKCADSIVMLNSERVTAKAVKIGIINNENYNETLEAAVAYRAVKAISVLNKMYKEIQKKQPRRIALKKKMEDKKSYFYTCG